MYKSPIEIKLDDIVSDAVEKADEYIVKYVQQIGVNVDKDELIKALKFDRGQYEKGWNDRDNEIVRCKDCKFFRRYGFRLEYADCIKFDFYDTTEDGYCCWAERREDGKTD